ncbi:hypothetical protein OPT61_g3395 [Boeremia exigua]|uniref:Uncharacterized protein n=1 Tax=Boeremia exigua TaxID=749465 RepID=A0ACC2IHY6_9PLEO|nr:hypothetical protein OPT61_g3395 [Boeremia exigua]
MMVSSLLKPTLVLGLWAARSLAVPAPSPDDSPATNPALSCWDNASNGQTYTAKNADWEIICGKDYVGGDLGASSAASFEDCINDCDTVTGCIDVSFVWPSTCYKKNKLKTATDNGSVWTARKKVPASGGGTPAAPSGKDVTCEDNASNGVTYTSTKGSFLIECGFDHYGGDMGASPADTFAACIDECAATDGCVDVSYVDGTCYKKNFLTEGDADGHVWSAKLIAGDTGSAGTSTSIACPSSDGKTDSIASGGTYKIACGFDYYGGDFKSLQTTSFDSCLKACDENDGCRAVSYVAPVCYLKNQINTGMVAGHVWGALLQTPSSSSSSAVPTPTTSETSTSTTPTPTSTSETSTSTTPTPTPTALSIISMFYADRDITQYAKQVVPSGTQLVINTNNIVSWANGDPWPGQAKSISMLFSYGTELRTFVVQGGTGIYVLNPGPASSQPNVQVVPGYEPMSGVSNINIVAVAYGLQPILSRSVFQNMYDAIRNSGGRWQYTNGNFQIDTWPGIVKTGVIWYQNTDSGNLIAIAARENNYNFFYNGRWSKRQSLPWSG